MIEPASARSEISSRDVMLDEAIDLLEADS